MSLLENILAHKRLEVVRQQEAIGIDWLLHADQMNRPVYSLKKALQDSKSGILSEFKRKSPSKGWIYPEADVEIVVPGYAGAGAAAISVLTDERFFGGSFSDFFRARRLVNIPLLRKDFIVSDYQIYQSRAMGADAILLIAAALSKDQVSGFVRLAHELGLEVLLEVHHERELDYVSSEIDVIGVNNRDLVSFETSVDISFRLIEKLPVGRVCISESGISSPETVRRLRKVGYSGFLMGENFMKEENPDQALSGFIKALSE